MGLTVAVGLILGAAGAEAASVTIQAFDRETNAAIPEFRFLINEDIAHENASTTPPRSYSPVVATGDNTSATVDLDPGKYLVTVLAGPFPAVPGEGGRDCEMNDRCGYKLGGAHFSVPGTSSVRVDLVPNPLPLATMQVRVFHDNFSVNNEDDIPLEDGLQGFHVVVHDPFGEVTVDFFGDPLCGGRCVTDRDGYVTIEHLPPLKYEVEVVPPDGSNWIQTTTIEGTHAIDAWLEEGADGLSTEEGFTQAVVWFGFVRPCNFGQCSINDPPLPQGPYTITGRVRQIVDIEAPGQVLLGAVVPRPFIALNNLSGNDEQVWMGRGRADGTFSIPNVAPGLYQIVYWDLFQDYIIQFATVRVTNRDVDVGDLGMPRWFGTIAGYVYTDSGVAGNGTPIGDAAARNGVRDCLPGANPHRDFAMCEPGIRGEELAIRHKDGTVVYSTFSDANGFYSFPEYFEWEHFLIWEVGYGRGEQIGTCAYATVEEGLRAGLPVAGYPHNPAHCAGDGEFGPAALLIAQQTPTGFVTWIDTGKLPWGPGENGGISGIVYYGVTRNEFDPRFAAAEDYEPGIPNVTINLYEAELNANGRPLACTSIEVGCPFGRGELKRATDDPIDSVQTDSWDDNLPTDCEIRPFLGLPGFTDPDCLELPRALVQVKDGVFDGGYAFEGIPAGTYIVEVVPPFGYRHIREEDQNTDQGDVLRPAVAPFRCAGRRHLVNDPRNPAHGTRTRLCDSRLVELADGFNPGVDFFLMTDFDDASAVPPPGLLRGVLLDDLTIEVNPDSPTFGEKRGIPDAPIGILDFQGNEVARVYSDENGYWEVLLPSAYTAHCPTPGGICPGMYQVVGNYPGSPQEPDPRWNPNYGTLRLVFDVWPGSWTFADVAIFPVTGFVQDPNSGFLTPPSCEVPAARPDVRFVSTPVGSPGTSFTITGIGFGTLGRVTLNGTPVTTTAWSDTSITATVPDGSGPKQLLVEAGNGQVTTNGITFHVLGAGYNPIIHDVGAGASIQDALDAASDGDLILVHPGVYFESIVVAKNIKLQGFGPGPGSGSTVIDGRFFNFGGLTPDEFNAMVDAIGPLGPSPVPMGQAITLLATTPTQHGPSYNTQIDGFAIRGGTRVRGNRVEASQGGGIYAHAFIRHLEVSNNLIQSNAGNVGGGVILGQPYVTNPDALNQPDNRNDLARIRHNRVLNNGGVSLAGAIALFNGANQYEIAHNVICGNYSAEYGGGISHFGKSPGGQIRDNEVLFNYAFDEGGGIMIAGEQPRNPNQVSPGSGRVLIERNLVQFNLSNDDGGGIRLLQPVDGPVMIRNNMIVNNLATDHGGGISLDDALDVRIVSNTIAGNVTTGTAEDAVLEAGPFVTAPQGAGLSSEPHSQALINARGLAPGSFSDPAMFNNIFWENEAFFLDGAGDLASAGFFDLDVVASDQKMSPYASLLTDSFQEQGSGTDNLVGMDPQFVAPILTDFAVVAFADDPKFVTVVVISSPSDPRGDYHLQNGSPAIDMGARRLGAIRAPFDDFDGDPRPRGTCFDIGADESLSTTGTTTCVVLEGPGLAQLSFPARGSSRR